MIVHKVFTIGKETDNIVRATTGQQAKGEGVVNSSKQIIKTQTINSSRKCFKFVLFFARIVVVAVRLTCSYVF